MHPSAAMRPPVPSVPGRRRAPVSAASRRRRALTGLFALAAAPAAVVGLAGPAQAHDELLRSTPEAGQRLDRAPEQVSLTFSGELVDGQGIQNLVQVRDADGNQWQAEPGAVDGDTLSATLCPGLPNGEYELAYRVVYSDGHSDERRLDFTLDADDAPAAGTAPQDCGVPAADSAGQDTAASAGQDTAGAQSVEPGATEAQDRQSAEQALPGWAWPAGLAGVAVIGLAAVLMFRKASALGHTTPGDPR